MPTSFKLYTDSGLTTEYGGVATLTHQTDLSDNPQDIQLWLGSTNSAVKLQANSNPGVDNINLTPAFLLSVWQASTAYVVADRRVPTVQNGYVYAVKSITGGGTTGASEPTWPTAIGSTVVDNEVTWECLSKDHDTTEIKLATTVAGLTSATGGAALSLGTEILGGSVNAVEVNIRIENSVDVVASTGLNYELGLNWDVIEVAV